MLIRTTGPVGEGLFLLTFGESCHYLAQSGGSVAIFDPGLSVHVPALLKRIEALGLSPRDVTHIFITHAHADRSGGLPALRDALARAGASVQVTGPHLLHHEMRDEARLREWHQADLALSSAFQQQQQPLSFEQFASGMKLDRIAADSDLINVGRFTVRAVATPGHTGSSFAYFVQPGNHLLVDEGFGYYRGRLLAAPGGDDDLRLALASIKKVEDLELASLCMPTAGAITGNLIRRHMHSVAQNTEDLFVECGKAAAAGITAEEIKRSVFEQFYAGSTDPSVRASLDRSFAAAWRQLEPVLTKAASVE